MKVLFLNHKIINCGIYQYGIRLFNILVKSENITYIYKEIDSFNEYNSLLENQIEREQSKESKAKYYQNNKEKMGLI